MRQWAAIAAFALIVAASRATAADSEDPTRDVFDHAVRLYDAGNYEEAYRIFRSIDDENLAAMHNVAFMRRNGQGTARDAHGAEEMYQRAAMGGDPRSQAELGEMLMKGEAGAPDPKSAAGWLALAAAAHHPVAEFELGELYEEGRGVPKDIEIARQLYGDASSRGVPGAKERLDGLPPPRRERSQESPAPRP